jgi:hypothetical protein
VAGLCGHPIDANLRNIAKKRYLCSFWLVNYLLAIFVVSIFVSVPQALAFSCDEFDRMLESLASDYSSLDQLYIAGESDAVLCRNYLEVFAPFADKSIDSLSRFADCKDNGSVTDDMVAESKANLAALQPEIDQKCKVRGTRGQLRIPLAP